MALTPEETIMMLQAIFDRGEQARLPPEQLKIANGLLRRGAITAPDQELEKLDNFQFFERTLGQQIKGTGEMALTMLTGALTEPLAGLEGIIHGVAAFVAGDNDPLLRAAETVQRRRERGTRLPRTEAGRESLQAVAAPIEALFKNVVQPLAEAGGRVVEAATMGLVGSVPVSTAIQTVAETFPMGRPRPGDVARRRQGQQRVRDLETSTGISLDLPIEMQAERAGQRAEVLTQGQTSRAQNFGEVQQSLINAREIAKNNTDVLFDIARDTKAAVPRDFITVLNTSIKESIKDFDITDFKGDVMSNRVNLNNRLKELDALVLSENRSAVQLNELSAFRQRLNRNQGLDASERLALGKVKGVLDSFLDDMFNADMVSGDPAAIQRWRDANAAFADYKKTFSDDKVIAKLTEQEVNATQIKSWIMGTNAVGAKVQAADVVNSIADIIGRDSPQFDAIRKEVLFDVLQPIMKPEVTPADLKAYVKNYDKFVRNNKPFADSVFPESIGALKDLRDLAQGATGVLSTQFQFNFSTTAARGLWGNALARSAVRIGLLAQVFALMGSAGTTRARQISARISGYSLQTPVLPVRPLLGVGAFQTLGEPTQEQRQMLNQQLRAVP